MHSLSLFAFVCNLLAISATTFSTEEPQHYAPRPQAQPHPQLLPFPPFLAAYRQRNTEATSSESLLIFEHCHLLASGGSYVRLTRTCLQPLPDERILHMPFGHVIFDDCVGAWIPRTAQFNGIHRFINFFEKPLDITAPCEAVLERHYAQAVLEAILPL